MFEKDLKKAQKLLNNIRQNIAYQFNNFERIYPFTNENLVDCFKYFDLKDKECLTVLGSSDQTLDMCLQGAKSVKTFDINPLTYYYFELKKAALLAKISKKEFFTFFSYHNFNQDGSSNQKVFNFETFIKLKPYLSKDSFLFWSKLFDNFSIFEIRNVKSLFYFHDEESWHVLQNTINYLDDNNYEKMQSNIKKLDFSFIHSDIRKISIKLDKTYDFIYLSNIIQYIYSFFNNCNDRNISLESYKKCFLEFKKIVDGLIPYLNKDGVIVVGYFYIPDYLNDSDLQKYKIMSDIFINDNNDYNFINFKSIMAYDNRYVTLDNHLQDRCLIYRKI